MLLATGDDEWRAERPTVRWIPPGNVPTRTRRWALIAVLQSRDGLLEALGTYANCRRQLQRRSMGRPGPCRTLKLAVAQLRMVFRAERVIDFMELYRRAGWRWARSIIPPKSLTAWTRASSICWSTSSRTRRAQFELLEKLTGGWQPGDGRTLFLVGDPMQSIIGFARPRSGCLARRRKGIGGLRWRVWNCLNRRSRRIVERVNTCSRTASRNHR